jgi:amino acid transporter
MTSTAAAPAPEPVKRFGAFSGVFTPSVLTILGVIMYLRLGWATGQVGLLGILGIVVVSHLITIATGLSVASLATSRTVGVGGAYNIISRSLGAPAGAAIGFPLFLAQALSVTFYIVGFTESLRPLLPGMDERLVGSAVLVGLVVLSGKSANLAIKAQYIILVVIVASLVSLFLGRGESPPDEITWLQPAGLGLTAVFAVFFPAVTGIMAGVGMSGDLRNPKRDLPWGVLSAIGVGMVIYLVLPVWFSMNASSDELMGSTDIAWKIAAVPSLIFLGVWGATLSSALGSVLTAPRTLQALAGDGLAPRVLGRGSGPSNEPRIALALTFALAEVGILLGNLDVIAPILTMFFLATYGLTNLACGLERWAASPGFRPVFKVPATVSLLGSVACFYVMSIINLPAMLVALILCGAIFVFTGRRDLGTTYGDARHGIWSALVRSALLKLREASFHPGNWRPNLIILGGNPEKRPWLLELGSALVQKRGIVTYFLLLTGSVGERVSRQRAMQRELTELFRDDHPSVFFRVDVVPEVYPGIVQVAQSYGVGSFEANTVMLGWPSQLRNTRSYARMLRELLHLDRSLLLIHSDPVRGLGERRAIHIWWGGLPGNGGLMLLLAHLLLADPAWRDAKVTLITVVDDESQRARASELKERIIEDARIDATTQVILRGGRGIGRIMAETSGDADLAIMGIAPPPGDDEADAFFERMNRMLEGMPTTLLVRSARTFRGEPVLFEMDETR